MSFCVSGYLIVLSLEDIQKKKVSTWLLVTATIAGFAYALINQRGWSSLVDILPGVILCLMAIVLPDSLGIGDGLLGIIYGLVYGWLKTCLWLMFGFVLAAVAGVLMCIRNKDKRVCIPFIPFLTIVHVGMCL